MDNKYMNKTKIIEAAKELDDFIAKLNEKNGLVWMHGGGSYSPNKPNAK